MDKTELVSWGNDNVDGLKSINRATYPVESGDSMVKIAAWFNTPLADLLSWIKSRLTT